MHTILKNVVWRMNFGILFLIKLIFVTNYMHLVDFIACPKSHNNTTGIAIIFVEAILQEVCLCSELRLLETSTKNLRGERSSQNTEKLLAQCPTRQKREQTSTATVHACDQKDGDDKNGLEGGEASYLHCH